MRKRVKDVKNLIARNIPQARQMLRKLLVDRLELAPFDENGRRGYRLPGRARMAGYCRERPFH